MRVLVAPDKFKGSLTAREVAEAIAQGLDDEGIDSRMLPLADGGDGSVAAALSAGFPAHSVEVRNAEGQTHEATFATNGTPRSSRSPTPAGSPPSPVAWRR